MRDSGGPQTTTARDYLMLIDCSGRIAKNKCSIWRWNKCESSALNAKPQIESLFEPYRGDWNRAFGLKRCPIWVIQFALLPESL